MSSVTTTVVVNAADEFEVLPAARGTTGQRVGATVLLPGETGFRIVSGEDCDAHVLATKLRRAIRLLDQLVPEARGSAA